MNNANADFDFNKSEARSNRQSIQEARAQRKLDAVDLSKDLTVLKKEVDNYLNALKQYKTDFGNLSRTQEKDLQRLTTYAAKLENISGDVNKDYEKSLDLVKDVATFLDKTNEKSIQMRISQSKTEEEYNELIQERIELEETYGSIVDDVGRKLETNKKANESALDSFSNNLKSLKNDVAQIATITGLDKIYSSLTGNGGQLATYNTMRSQFAMTKSDFNQFKRDIVSSVAANGNLLKYGFQDALDYMNRLGDLGITDLDLAREQMDAIMLSTKYLGMSVETQSKILRQARNIGSMDLLNQTNQTMVQIMNAQLGVSRDQLNAIVDQSTELADLSVMFSGNPRALQNFTTSASAIESVYGESAAKATLDIAKELLNNGGNSKYVAVLGQNYGDIIKGLQAGDGSALYQILQAVQSSRVSQAGAANASSWSSLTGAGILDLNTAAIYNSRASEGKSYLGAMESIASSSNDTKKYLDSIQLDFKSMFENFTSWINAWIPLQSLQTIYYTLAIADLLVGGSKGLIGIVKTLGSGIIKPLQGLFTGQQSATQLLNGVNPSLLTITKILSGVAGGVMAISDGIGGYNKSEEWGTSKGASAIGGALGGTGTGASNTLLNAVKGGLIGFAIGGPPGAIIGALGGGILGLIGGKNIANLMNSMVGDMSGAPVTSYGYGMGESVSSANFPWRLTSPFGYRGSINTSKGKTNPFHSGIDLASADGTPIGANNSGIVSAVGTANDGANYVIINSGDGYEQLYWHLNKPSTLQKGQTVLAGQLIGYMGATGKATGPHLHFGLRHAGTTNYIDPINSVNSTLFNPTEEGVPNMNVWLPGMAEEDTSKTTTILTRLVDADTMSKETQALAYSGIGSEEVVNSVNGGFAGLISKLDELAARQDEQETLLRMLSQSKGTNIYKY